MLINLSTLLYSGRVDGEGGGHVPHHNFFTLFSAVDEALASPLPMILLDAIHEDEGESEVTTQTLANHANEAASAEGEQIDAGEYSIYLHLLTGLLHVLLP